MGDTHLVPDQLCASTIVHGGEARQPWLAQAVAGDLGSDVFVADPLAGNSRFSKLLTPGLDLNELQPGWTVPCGLCHAPSDQ